MPSPVVVGDLRILEEAARTAVDVERSALCSEHEIKSMQCEWRSKHVGAKQIVSESQASHNKFYMGLLCFDCDHALFLLNDNDKLFDLYFLYNEAHS